jgi:hypothetical protein
VSIKKRQPPVPWEPADKARALVLLRENQGALRATARQWNTMGGRRLTEATLRLWRDNPAEQPAAPLVVDARRDRIGVLKSILRHLEQGLEKALVESPGIVSTLARRQPSALATTIGILTDKVRLLEGESTENTAVQVSYAEPGSLRKLALTVIEGGREEAS